MLRNGLAIPVRFVNDRRRESQRAADGPVVADELTAAERLNVTIAEEEVATFVVPEMDALAARRIRTEVIGLPAIICWSGGHVHDAVANEEKAGGRPVVGERERLKRRLLPDRKRHIESLWLPTCIMETHAVGEINLGVVQGA